MVTWQARGKYTSEVFLQPSIVGRKLDACVNAKHEGAGEGNIVYPYSFQVCDNRFS